MTSSPLDSTHGHMKSGVTCHHCLWTAHTVGLGRQRRAWHDIIALGQHTRSDYVGRGMTSPPFDSTHGRTTSIVACHHRLWAAQTVERLRAWNTIIALEWQTWSNDVGRGMLSPPLDIAHGRTTSWAVPLCEPWSSSNNLCSD